MGPWKRRFLLEINILRGYVSFREGKGIQISRNKVPGSALNFSCRKNNSVSKLGDFEKVALKNQALKKVTGWLMGILILDYYNPYITG